MLILVSLPGRAGTAGAAPAHRTHLPKIVLAAVQEAEIEIARET
jgi:hypothetical protein